MQDFKHPLFDEVYHFTHLNSTMTKATSMLKSQLAQGNFLITADRQSSGTGRKKNSWYSPEGGIWCTIALYGMNVGSYLTLFSGICIHRALVQHFPQLAEQLTLKWPNDIFLGNRKIAGILTTHLPSHKYHFIGIGIDTNVAEFTEELQSVASSTLLATGEHIDNRALLWSICQELADGLPQLIEDSFPHDYFAQNCLLTGKTVILDTDFEQFSGLCKGVNSRGALMLELAPGMIQPFFAGSVVHWSAAAETEDNE